ncbi:hypothetical protein SAMN02745221_00259 [Thermosyntropha lipolytica DSM 11003]|uniref:DUF8042 domain-containing protein n=1 Tax=Thermosyntropha lipolytica DSM 11003 TaxID=1123382 RepID=A0A1M5K1Q8_9FIRM|nr:hypothetical protein [Thermosyntropha lipolytica]SHG46707.1 hypothetical protein SAMN02745221_00259 [Thermosyntropha lipolytica DSM 11003]
MGQYVEYNKMIDEIISLLSLIEKILMKLKRNFSMLPYEEKVKIINSCFLGITIIKFILRSISERNLKDVVLPLTTRLELANQKVVEACKKENPEQLEIILNTEILPAFIEWKSELEKTFSPYISS